MGRILVIEDDPAILELIVYLVHALGHHVITAEDGEAGLALAQSEPVDLILCDLRLPKLDGYEIADRLKQDSDLCTIPLIAVTAFAMTGDQERILAAGFDRVITKPLSARPFMAQVEELLDP